MIARYRKRNSTFSGIVIFSKTIVRITLALTFSRPLHKTLKHHLAAGLVEIHGQLVAVHIGHGAVAEFDMEDARA